MNKGKYGSVLVVDDEPTVLESSSLLLKEYGYNVVSSSSAEDAIKRFQENNIDVVVTDIVMPSISGIELLRLIHDINPTIPVILMTAFADMEKVLGAIRTGAFNFIIKPFTIKNNYKESVSNSSGNSNSSSSSHSSFQLSSFHTSNLLPIPTKTICFVKLFFSRK